MSDQRIDRDKFLKAIRSLGDHSIYDAVRGR
jgi:hypothetical protein